MNIYQINYELDNALTMLLTSVDEETGEVNPEALKNFNELQIAKEEKLENIACYIKNLKAESAALKAEEDNLAKRRQAVDNHVKRLVALLEQNTEISEKYKFTRATISYRHSTKLEITDEALIPKKLLRIKTEPDKIAIKEILATGKKVKGCQMVDNYSIQIK